MKQQQKMRAMTRLFSPAVLALALLCSGAVALAGNQVAGVTSLVADMIIPIGLEGDTGSIKVNTKTDANGNYSFSGLPPGKYKLIIPGQQPQTIIIGKDGRLNGRVQKPASAGVIAPVKPAVVLNLQRGFSLEIAGLPAARETRIDGLQEALGKAESSAKAGGGNGASPKPGKIVITKDWSNTLEWDTWRRSIIEGKTDRRSVSIIFHDDSGAEVGRMNFYNCWPTQHVMPSFNAKNSGHATEQIELAYEDVRLK